MKALVGLLILGSSFAQASVVCHVDTQMGPAKVEIGESSVTITGAALSRPEVYDRIDAQWDGHETELITAPGLSISYQDWYGCIHNARVTANFRDSAANFIESVDVSQCTGGSTADSVCHAR